MSQWEKLLEKLYSKSSEMRFQDLKIILEHYGYRMDLPRGGSHRTFRKPNARSITIPEKSPVKTCYIELVQRAVEDSKHERS